MTKKLMLYLSCTTSCLKVRNAVVPLVILWAAYNTDASADGTKVAQSHVAHHFSCLNLRNAMVPLIVLSRPHDADINKIALHESNSSASGIK